MEYTDFKTKNDEKIFSLVNHRVDNDKLVPLLHFDKLEAAGMVKHCFTTRAGGVSENIFSTMNLSFTRGDDKDSVMENYRRIASTLRERIESFVCSDQTHTTNVLRVGKEQCGIGVTREKPYTDVDGLITNEPGVVLATFYADCVPLYFVDTKNKAIGLSHSGWKGTVGRMGQATLQLMVEEFGTNPTDVVAAIGPSICQDCYEVSEDVAEQFADEFRNHQDEILINKGKGKYLLDLWKANEIVLTEAGVKKDNIAVTNICTCCNPALLFSHRASQGKRGNLGGVYVPQMRDYTNICKLSYEKE